MAKREPSGGPAGDLGYAMRTLAAGLAAGLFLGVVGPFGTFATLPLLPRLGYWVAVILAGTLFVPVLYLLTRSWLAARVPAFVFVPLVAAIGSLPIALMVIAITLVLFGDRMAFDARLYLLVLIITLPMVIVQHGLWMFREARRAPAAMPVPVPGAVPAAPAPAPPTPRARLLERLPGRLGREILCLQMEDHYVRVHTPIGSELILMRMRDAVAELDGMEGMQVHRSWWVARAALAGWNRAGKAVTLDLTNGLNVPVARDRLAEVRAAGWLGR